MLSWVTFTLPVATYVGGVLTKPLQALIEDWRAQRKLRNSFYADLGHNLDVAGIRMRILLKMPNEYDDVLHATFVKETFTYAIADPSRFHQLRESRQIRLFYSMLNAVNSAASEKELLGAMGLLIRHVADGIRNGDYRRKSVYRHISQITKTMIEARERGLNHQCSL
jgi:hypothetical protein